MVKCGLSRMLEEKVKKLHQKNISYKILLTIGQAHVTVVIEIK